MRKNYIVSIMPPVLDYLRNLRHLDLSHNIIVGGDHRLLTFDLSMMTELETFIISYQSYVELSHNNYANMGNFNRSTSDERYQEKNLNKHHSLCKHNISLPANLTRMDIGYRNSLLQGPFANGICVNGNNSLKYLMFEHNLVEEYVFGQILNFPFLQTLDLHKSRMVFSSYRMFEKMNNLQLLNVCGCELQWIIDLSPYGKNETWQRIISGSNLQSLKYLDMSNNGLIFLPNNLFQDLKNLEIISLSLNLLSSFSINMTHLKNMKKLDLSFNRISFLPSNLLDLWPNVSFKVNLGHNNIFSGSCNDILPLSILAKVERSGYIKVSGVKFCNESWVDVCYDNKMQECYQKKFLVIAFCMYGISVLLLAITSSIFKLKWRFVFPWKYLKLLLNKYQEDNRDLTELKYDAFVCYSHRDYNWVVRILMPMLEDNYGYKLCIHERDFEPGAFIDVNIMQSFQQSKSVILVITKQSLRSSFLNFELHIAREQAMNVICVFLEKPNSLLNQRLPPTLEYFI